MASEAPESSRAREDAAQREASEEAAHQQQRPWVALSSIAVVYRPRDMGAEKLAPGVADFLLDLCHPPRCSYLWLPKRLAPDPRSDEPTNYTYIIAVNSDRVLFMASQMATQRRQLRDVDYFLCDVRARAGTATRLPLVPADLGVRLLPRRSMGLIADADPRHPGHYMVAQLNPVAGTSMRRHDSLLCYSTTTGQWAVKQLAAAPDHEPWGAHGVFVHDDLLWWVDVAHGILFCNPFDNNPRLRFVPLPPGCEMQGMPSPARARLLDQRRCVRPSQGKLRYVEIQGLSYDPAAVNDPPNNPAVLMWTLVNPSALPHWKLEREASFDEIWAHETYIAAGLPQGKVPKLAVVDPSNHDVVFFFQDASLFALGMRDRRVLACEEGFVDHVFQDLGFQFSRFVDAWVLPPTLRVGDPASSDGGSGTEGPDEEEVLDAVIEYLEEDGYESEFQYDDDDFEEDHALKEQFTEAALLGQERPCVLCFRKQWRRYKRDGRVRKFSLLSIGKHYKSYHKRILDANKKTHIKCTECGNVLKNSFEYGKHKANHH